MSRTYRVSFGSAAFGIGFSLVWFGFLAGVVLVRDVPHDRQLAHLAVAFVVLLIAVAPALAVAFLPYEVTLTDLGELECRALLRRQCVRALQIHALECDEEYIYLKHDRGKITLIDDENFKALLARLFELNPAITADDESRRSIGVAN